MSDDNQRHPTHGEIAIRLVEIDRECQELRTSIETDKRELARLEDERWELMKAAEEVNDER